MRLYFFIFLLLAACESSSTENSELPALRYAYTDEDVSRLPYQEKVYVPIYSEIYHSSGSRRFLLTATLSIRNVSLQDTLYVARVDYYDSDGSLNRVYLDRPIQLSPLASVEFVVADNEDKGGAGANFIVDWRSALGVHTPVIEAVMIGTSSQQGISFLTESVVIESQTDTTAVHYE